jgi:hypothetical protein
VLPAGVEPATPGFKPGDYACLPTGAKLIKHAYIRHLAKEKGMPNPDHERIGRLLDALLSLDPTCWVCLDESSPSQFTTRFRGADIYIDVFSSIKVGGHSFLAMYENDRKKSKLWNSLVRHFYKIQRESASLALDALV